MSTARPAIESLENRTLFHNPVVLGVTADNRGEVFIRFDADSAELSPSQFNKSSVQMFLNGDDGIAGTDDDQKISASIRFTQADQRLLVRGNVPAGVGYRVRILANQIGDPGSALDGEFDGTFPTGNNVAGGNFQFQSKNDRSSRPKLRMHTTEGTLDVTMLRDFAPISVKNYFNYADSGRYDNIFFTRSVNNFVVQGGSLQIINDGARKTDIVETVVDATIQNEFRVSNTRGTLAFAKQGDNPNSATNQFFFNLTDNSANLDTNNGGFTVFGTLSSASLDVMDGIGRRPRADLTSQIGPFSATGVNEMPVKNKAAAETKLRPASQLIVIRRTALLVRVASV